MIVDCPDPKEVSDFHFLQLKTLRLAKENEKIPAKPVNILASASKYGLLFAGIEGGFKVLKLDDILTLDEDKESKGIEVNYPCSFVQCETPSFLALSANQKILAVCSTTQSGTNISFFDIASFAYRLATVEGTPWQPFATIPSKLNSTLSDFVWNPANEEFYSYCLSDGSLHVEELSGTCIKSVASLPGANASTVCWSPKGKQLVAGQTDGTFTQYKPSLAKVKTVPPPELVNPISISSICWISNTTYAVVYVAAASPYLFIVSTPKDSPVTYTNFYDVCLGNNSKQEQKYFLHLEPLWGILICSSTDSIEIAVLGDMPDWVQWDLREDRKALLPGKDGAAYPIGCTVMYSSQKKLVISESECYPPMPVIFMMTNNGLLVSFYVINGKADAASLVSAPLILEPKKVDNTAIPAAEADRMVLKRSSSSSVQPSATSSNSAAAPSTHVSSVISPASGPGLTQPLLSSPFNTSKPLGEQNFLQQNNNIQPPIPASTNSNSNENVFPQQNERKSSIADSPKPVQNLSRPWENTAVSQAQSPVITQGSEKFQKNEMESERDKSYITAILSEIHSFNKELNELKQLQSAAPCLDSMEEMAALKVFALNLQSFQKDISEATQSLSTNIFTLKNVLLESFSMVEEAISLDRRRNDHSYITMLKERALDPVTAKRMQKMSQHYQYLSTQLHEVNDKLDQDRINFLSKKKSARNPTGISSTEAVYKTIVNNQKIIHNLRKRLDLISKKSEEKKLRGMTKSTKGGYQKKYAQEDLSKLADEFLQVKLANTEERETTLPKKLSSESQNFLKEYLKDANVVTVRPIAVYSPSQSRLLSNTIQSGKSYVELQEKGQAVKQISVPTTSKEAEIPQGSSYSLPSVSKESMLFTGVPEKPSADSSTSKFTPVYEPITPPDIISPPQSLFKAAVSKDKNDLTFSFKSGIGSTSTPGVTVFKQPSQKIPETVLSPSAVTKPISESPPSVSLFSGQNFSEQIFSRTQPLAVPKALPFTPPVSKNAETASKPASSAATTPFAFTFNTTQTTKVAETKQSGNLIPCNTEPKPVASVASLGTKSLISSQSSAFTLQETSNATKSVFSGFNFGTSSAIQGTNISPKTPSFPSFNTSENKSAVSSEFKNTGLTPIKPPVGDNLNISLPTQEEINISVTSSETKSSSDTDSSNKIIVVDIKNLNNPQVFQAVDELKSGVLDKSTGTKSSSNQVTEEKPINTVATSLTNTVTNLFTLKQSQTTPVSSVSSPMPVITSVSGSYSLVSNSSQIAGVSPASDISPSVIVPSPANTETENSIITVSFTTAATVTESNTISTPVAVQAMVSVATSAPTAVSACSTTAVSTPMTALTTTPAQAVSTSATVLIPTPDNVPTSTLVTSTETVTLPSSSLATNTTITPHVDTTAPKPNAAVGSVFFSPPNTVAPAAALFGQNVTSPTAGSETPTTKSETVTSAFGFKPAPLFAQAASETPIFGSTTATPNSTVFGQPAVSQSSLFGQPVSNSGFGQTTGGGFFSQTPSFGTSGTTNTSDPNSQSAFSFGKSTFGQASSGSFGLAKSLFGQTTTASDTQPQSPAATFSFGQQSSSPENSFGQGAFFSGLGSKPTEENANKNVFGFGNTAKPNNTLFGNSGPTSFGAKSGAFGGGSFSGGAGSVAQSGFGSFQQASPQKPGGFGAAPAFGSSPAFGSPPTFGSTSPFGTGNALSSVFGSQQPQQANFSNFASASSPTFGSLASQTSTFGSSPSLGSFGATQNAPTFGSTSPFGGSFGGGQSATFGSPSTPPSNSSAFTQWRN